MGVAAVHPYHATPLFLPDCRATMPASAFELLGRAFGVACFGRFAVRLSILTACRLCACAGVAKIIFHQLRLNFLACQKKPESEFRAPTIPISRIFKF
jgi:hypothetical protein